MCCFWFVINHNYDKILQHLSGQNASGLKRKVLKPVKLLLAGRNNSQLCKANDVGSCCVRLHIAYYLSNCTEDAIARANCMFFFTSNKKTLEMSCVLIF